MSEENVNENIGFLDYSGKDKSFGSHTDRINVDKAKHIRAYYNASENTPRLVNNDGIRIRGFSFTREDVEMALYGKQLDPKLTDASSIHLAFGRHIPSINSHDPKGYTLVLYGVNSEGLIEVENRVRDYSKPCPPDENCPQSAK